MDFFTYGPLIWLKVTSLSSTASVLRDGKFSLKLQESIQKKSSKHQNNDFFSPEIIDFNNLIGSEKLCGLNDLNRHDNITGFNDLKSLFGLKKIKSCLHFNYWMISLQSGTSAASMTSTASMTSVASMASTASYHQKTY